MMSNKSIAFFDVECYANYFYVLFKTYGANATKHEFRMHNGKKDGDLAVLRAIFKNQQIVSFNGINYDMWIIGAYLSGYTNAKLKQLSDDIIVKGMRSWVLIDHHPDIKIPASDHIDLVGATPLQAGLKVYGCRIHSPKLQDLPIDPSATISESDAALLERYCENDVDVTKQIYDELRPQIELREAMTKIYSVDMRSKGDAQIAEAIFKQRLEEEGIKVERVRGAIKPFKYKPPEFIRFTSSDLQKVLLCVEQAEFAVNDKGSVVLPDSLGQVIDYAGAHYKLGIGGLHSQEKHQVVKVEGDHLGELDVASFYPSIILGQSLHPDHLTDKFCEVYRAIYDERLEAKHNGNKVVADTLKIVLNGSYGKFGSKYSFLYAPKLLIQTTLTGQLSLLMLIELVTEAGALVTSANTDGINVKFSSLNAKAVMRAKDRWERVTGYVLEWTPYQAVYSESVNSYIAIKVGGTKAKGLYEAGSIRKGYAAQVCNEAIIAHLRCGTPIEDTINGCDDIREFLTMRGVKGGAVWRDEALGKVVRWFVSTEGEPIRYASNGNKVAGSDGAYPMMDMAPMPDHLDRAAYVEMAKRKLKRLGL